MTRLPQLPEGFRWAAFSNEYSGRTVYYVQERVPILFGLFHSWREFGGWGPTRATANPHESLQKFNELRQMYAEVNAINRAKEST